MTVHLQRVFALAALLTVCTFAASPPVSASEVGLPEVTVTAESPAAVAESLPDHVDAIEPISAAETTPSAPTYRHEDDGAGVYFGRGWTFCSSESASGRSYRRSRTAGASVSTSFDGTGVTVIGPVGPDRGRARIYLDGKAVATIDTYAPEWATQQPLWRADGLGSARHNVRVVALNSKSATSTATYVGVDAFDIVGKPIRPTRLAGTQVQNGDSRLYKKGRWSISRRSVAFGKSSARTTQRDSGYTLRFKGTEVTWYGRKDVHGGKAEVYMDGKRVATVDQYSPQAKERRVAWAVSGLSDKVHTLRIRPLRTAAVDGGGVTTDLDAFQVRGTVLQAPRPTPFKYPWKNYIVIDKSSYKLYLVKNGWLIKTYPIAHGRNNWTPERVWRVGAKYPRTGGVYGPRKMRLFKRVKTLRGYRYVHTSYLIHGTNQPWVIGTQASAGCIRMYNKDVIDLYPRVPMGTMVVTRR